MDNWFEFLDRADRFYKLIRRTEPPTVKNIGDELLVLPNMSSVRQDVCCSVLMPK